VLRTTIIVNLANLSLESDGHAQGYSVLRSNENRAKPQHK